MICGWTCFISSMFIIGNLIFTYLMDKQGEVKKYQDTLTDEQKIMYKKIVDERKKLAMQGYALGIAMSVGFLVGRKWFIKSKKSLLSTSLSGLCATGAITFIVQYFFYILMPKSNWMLNHLNSEEQRDKWVKVYRAYSWNYHLSMLIGIIGASLLGYGFC